MTHIERLEQMKLVALGGPKAPMFVDDAVISVLEAREYVSFASNLSEEDRAQFCALDVLTGSNVLLAHLLKSGRK